MVSEGVDIPRLRVGVYATPKKTPLLFRQIVGRFVRTRSGPDNECSFLYLPADPQLRQLASEVERELTQQLPDSDEQTGGGGDEAYSEPAEWQSTFIPLAADVHARGALLSGTPVDPEEAASIDRIARRRGLTPDQVLRLLDGGGPAATRPRDDERPDFEVAEQLRRTRSRLVGACMAWSGQPHSEINSHVNRVAGGGRPVRDATVDELRAGNALLERLLTQASASER